MKRFGKVLTTAMLGFVMIMMAYVSIASAKDVILNAKIEKVVISKDKNGAEYVRVMIPEERTLSGVKYSVSTSVMFFGEHVEKAKLLKDGDALKVIAAEKQFNGRTSYTVIKQL